MTVTDVLDTQLISVVGPEALLSERYQQKAL